jgi:hypothetical protein
MEKSKRLIKEIEQKGPYILIQENRMGSSTTDITIAKVNMNFSITMPVSGILIASVYEMFEITVVESAFGRPPVHTVVPTFDPTSLRLKIYYKTIKITTIPEAKYNQMREYLCKHIINSYNFLNYSNNLKFFT